MPKQSFDIPARYADSQKPGIVREQSTDGSVSSETVGFEVGTDVAGRYRVTRFVGAGGMGEVYAAHDTVLDTDVALKTLRTELEGSHAALERFRREIALARKVTDPHVCRVFDVGEHEGRVFFTMELLEGTPLATRLTLEMLDRIAPQLVRGLAALHAQGVVHRDFKTANVIVVDDRVVITDFGLARSVDAKESTLSIDSGLLGTPAYMSPEQVEGRPATTASDVYALGVVLFELATGKRPFEGDTAMAIATARLTQTPPKASTLRADLPPAWDVIIARCLARDPAARPRIHEVLASPRMTRRTVLAAAGFGTVAAGLGAWRLFGGSPATKPMDPNAVIALLAVESDKGPGGVVGDPLRLALTVDVHDTLATSAIRTLTFYRGGHWEAFDFAALRRDSAKALQIPKVTTVVRTKLLERDPMVVEISIEPRGEKPIVMRRSRPITEATLLVDDIARAIAKTLGAKPPRRPADARAFAADVYPRYGVALGAYFTTSNDRIEELVEAVPELARAAPRLADRLVADAEQEMGAHVIRTMDRAIALADRALAIDPDLARAHAVRGHASMIKWDWTEADRRTKQAKQLAPTNQRVLFHRGLYAQCQGQFEEQLAHVKARLDIIPTSPQPLANLTAIYNNARRFDDVVKHAAAVMPQLPENAKATVLIELAHAYSELSRFEDAVAAADEAVAMVKDIDLNAAYELSLLVRPYVLAGQRDKALALRDGIYAVAEPFAKAMIDDALGDLETALAKFTEVVDGHNLHACFLKTVRISPQLRARPEFQALLKRVGLV